MDVCKHAIVIIPLRLYDHLSVGWLSECLGFSLINNYSFFLSCEHDIQVVFGVQVTYTIPPCNWNISSIQCCSKETTYQEQVNHPTQASRLITVNQSDGTDRSFMMTNGLAMDSPELYNQRCPRWSSLKAQEDKCTCSSPWTPLICHSELCQPFQPGSHPDA